MELFNSLENAALGYLIEECGALRGDRLYSDGENEWQNLFNLKTMSDDLSNPQLQLRPLR